MNKEKIVNEYQTLYSELYQTLDKLKDLMEGVEYRNISLNTTGDDDTINMYDDFESLLVGISEAY